MSKVQIVWFRDLVRWDIKHYLTEFKSKFPLVSLKDYIVEKKHRIKPSNFPNETFDILGVNNKDGVYFNESLLGSRIKQPYYQVRSGEIFYNPYRVNVGSIGIVPPEFDLKYTSPAYVIFQTDETRLLSQYLVFVLKSAWFNEHLRAKTRGSVRQNLSFEALCDLQIPLPPLKIQKQIIAKIQSIKAQIKALQDEEKRLKDEIEAYIYIALGLEKKQELQRQKVFIVRFKDLDRWDTRHNQSVAINLCHTDSASCHTDTTSPCHTEAIAEVSTNIESKTRFFAVAQNDNKSKKDISAQYDKPINTANLKALLDSIPTPPSTGWEVKTLGEICEIITGCTPQTNKQNFYGTEYPFYKPADLNDGYVSKSETMLSSLGYHSHRALPKHSILVTCIGATIGKTAIIEKSGVCNQQINALIPNEKFLPKYMYFLCSTQYFRDLLFENCSITTIPIINKKVFSNIKIPLPPLSVQEKILAHIHKIESSIATTQEKAKALELELTHYIESTL
ncbi:restriction endonuclease subunit S [Helicobacter canis]|uniref:Type I restriction modification DNA specificity domain-containing protein n=1 Tax=Helicobacter canis TaxID=29419 RepID=A0A5M9QHS5_9HELI|nr:restriction endonuclease subunit S [Helicobacter canis]KAA8707710.1 hypothetical protein F4V45_07505 [Helicobacter canis]